MGFLDPCDASVARASYTPGRRRRFPDRRRWWTTLDTFSPLTFGGNTELAEGGWFLALECSEEGEWSLIAFGPAPIRKARMDAFATAKTTGGTVIPLTYEAVTENEPELQIRFLTAEDKPTEQTLEIRFGKHRLTTRVAPEL